MERVITCPLGHTCEKAVDGRLEVCAWYTEVKGTNPQDGSLVHEKKCAMTWMPIMMMDSTLANRQAASSVDSLRNEMVIRQDAALEVLNEKAIKHQ